MYKKRGGFKYDEAMEKNDDWINSFGNVTRIWCLW